MIRLLLRGGQTADIWYWTHTWERKHQMKSGRRRKTWLTNHMKWPTFKIFSHGQKRAKCCLLLLTASLQNSGFFPLNSFSKTNKIINTFYAPDMGNDVQLNMPHNLQMQDRHWVISALKYTSVGIITPKLQMLTHKALYIKEIFWIKAKRVTNYKLPQKLNSLHWNTKKQTALI